MGEERHEGKVLHVIATLGRFGGCGVWGCAACVVESAMIR